MGQDHFHVLSLSDPIEFRVTVARENQQPFQGWNEFPTGSYWCAWDGIVLIVLWEQSSDERVSRSAGRIVADVVNRAAVKAGLRTYNQACSPGCGNIFGHTDAIITTRGSLHSSPRGVFMWNIGTNCFIQELS